ncbi:hypothetical protein EYF80_052958 [Liparis tanakae]|uniref:Uncharacterized protein n=1 Tax=Liparis tanakae TaxID=230148 RepID=A0A4Z2F7T6_9TELE|nr:hypothetical protein EYF80_052958 [Liparis tanakae]
MRHQVQTWDQHNLFYVYRTSPGRLAARPAACWRPVGSTFPSLRRLFFLSSSTSTNVVIIRVDQSTATMLRPTPAT